jgi:hypothetical protein
LGIHPAEVNELLLGWNASRDGPPLPDAEVTRVVVSIANKEFERKENSYGKEQHFKYATRCVGTRGQD